MRCGGEGKVEGRSGRELCHGRVGWGPGLGGRLLGERRRDFAREELGRRKKEMGEVGLMEEDRTEGRAKAKLGRA